VVPSAATPATDQIVVPGALTTSKVYSVANGALLQATAPGVQGGTTNPFSAPLILSGGVFFGNSSKLEKHTISAAGVLGNQSNAGTTGAYFEVITDGTSLFVWRGVTNGLNSRNPSNLNSIWSQTVTPTGAGAVALNGNIIASLAGGPVHSFAASNGAHTQLINLGGDGRAPLIGWDGNAAHEHFYLPRAAALTFALDASGNLSWEADPNGTTHRAFSMDCSGRLFGASNAVTGTKSLVYAIITDDRGLADTAWPSYRLDARNTGNVSSPKYGIWTTGPSGSCSQ